jgi:hypothetical protein
MSRSWNKAWNSTPRIDCGLCGLFTCAAFTRAIGAGFLSLDSCPILQLPEFTVQKSELEEYSNQSKRTRISPDMPNGGILLTRPCKDTDEKVMAEMRVFNGVTARSPMYFPVFDPNTLCDILECYSNRFDLIKCSRDLGYARADLDDRSITILQDGRINMRRITDKEEVSSIFSEIERPLLGSIICNCCGAELLSVLTGMVHPKTKEHPVLNAGSTFHLNLEDAKQALTKSKLSFLEEDDFLAITIAVDKLTDQLNDDVERILSLQLESREDYLSINEIRCSLVSLLSNRKYAGNETYLLKTLALIWTIENAILGIQELKVNLESIGPSHSKVILKNLTLARIGRLDISEKVTQDNILGFAHTARINRAMLLLDQWSA